MAKQSRYDKYYDLENYLFSEVTSRFATNGKIDPVDFYMILIWKAVRAKTKHRDRLIKKAGDFAKAVDGIAKSLRESDSPKRRLEILMSRSGWDFSLPTATAILTVLYPADFTVYDIRVRAEVRSKDLSYRRFSDELWADYEQFLQAVSRNSPEELSLRDKDRFLWGRSFYKQAETEIKKGSHGKRRIQQSRDRHALH